MLYAIAVFLPTLLGIAATGLILLHEEFDWLARRRASRRSAGRLMRALRSYLDRSTVPTADRLVLVVSRDGPNGNPQSRGDLAPGKPLDIQHVAEDFAIECGAMAPKAAA